MVSIYMYSSKVYHLNKLTDLSSCGWTPCVFLTQEGEIIPDFCRFGSWSRNYIVQVGFATASMCSFRRRARSFEVRPSSSLGYRDSFPPRYFISTKMIIVTLFSIQRSVGRVCSEVRSPPGVCFATVCFFLFVALVTVLSNKIYVTKPAAWFPFLWYCWSDAFPTKLV